MFLTNVNKSEDVNKPQECQPIWEWHNQIWDGWWDSEGWHQAWETFLIIVSLYSFLFNYSYGPTIPPLRSSVLYQYKVQYVHTCFYASSRECQPQNLTVPTPSRDVATDIAHVNRVIVIKIYPFSPIGVRLLVLSPHLSRLLHHVQSQNENIQCVQQSQISKHIASDG